MSEKNASSYRVFPNNRITRSFWTLNDEMHPRYKVTFVREIDATAMDRLRSTMERETGVKPSYTALVVKASAMVLSEFPYANRAILGPPFFKRLVQFNNIDTTVAIERDVPGAEAVVLADTIYDSISKSLVDISKELNGFVNATLETNERWRLFFTLLSRLPTCICKWIIRMPRFSPGLWVKHRGGVCFVNSPAKYGIDLVVGDMIFPFTVGFGWIKVRPLVVDGEVVARKTMPLSILFDRRIMAGAPAAKLFNRLALILENADVELHKWSGKQSE